MRVSKRTFRTGWVLRGVKNAESIADHMYRMAIMSFLAPKPLDKNKYHQHFILGLFFNVWKKTSKIDFDFKKDVFRCLLFMTWPSVLLGI